MTTRHYILAAVCFLGVIFVFRVMQVIGKDIVKEPSAPAATQPAADYSGPLAYTLKDIDGKDVNLADYRGKVVLIVNVASQCGYTKQYAGLEQIHRQYKDQGLVVLGFPANDFKQEKGTNEEIKTFCKTKYEVTFPIMSKLSVKGEQQHPLFKHLTQPATAGEFSGEIGWNFSKFLIDRNGQIYARFGSKAKPEDPAMVEAIEKGLK